MKTSIIKLSMLMGLLILCGCTTATLVTSSGDLGGVQSGPRWGIVKYLNQGADQVIDARKKDARRIMTEFCMPFRYKVVETGNQSSWAAFQGSGGSMDYLHIKFICVDSTRPGMGSIPTQKEEGTGSKAKESGATRIVLPRTTEWKGKWDSVNGVSGLVNTVFTYDEGLIFGIATFFGTECFDKANVQGVVENDMIRFKVYVKGREAIVFTARTYEGFTKMKGEYQTVLDGSRCQGDQGVLTLLRNEIQ